MTRGSAGWIGFLRRHALLPLAAGLVLTVLAPFGTEAFSLAGRALFWIGMTFAGGLGAAAFRLVIQRLKPDAPPWVVVLAVSIGATLAVSPFVLTMFGGGSPAGWAISLFYIWVVSCAISTVGFLMERSGNPVGPEPVKRPALMDRLPLGMRDATLYGVTSEDHYVRVHTSAGDHMLLMRLADVEALAHPVAGLSPHRSWWVAADGIESVDRQGGKMGLTLKDGTKVPVSRAGAQRVKSAGWLAR